MGLLNRRDDEPTGETALTTAVAPTELSAFAECRAAADKAMVSAKRFDRDVTDREAASIVTDLLRDLKHARQAAEKARKETKAPFADAGKRIDAAFKELQSPIEAAERSLKDRLLAFERQRQKEERERREAEEREALKAKQEAEEMHDPEAERDARQDLRRAQAPRKEPTGARGSSGAKASPVSEVKYEITDPDKLPDEYVERVPKRSKILADVRQGVVIPGVHAWTEDNVRVG